MTSLTTFDALKGAALVCTFLGFLAMCAALVHWHDKTWKIAVEPTKASVFRVGARSSAPLGDGQEATRMVWLRPVGAKARGERVGKANARGLSRLLV